MTAWAFAVSFVSFVLGCIFTKARERRLDFEYRCKELDAAVDGTGPALADFKETDALTPGAPPLITGDWMPRR